MHKKYKYICLVFTLIFTSSFVAQELVYKNQNKITGLLNPSFYAFGESSKVGVLYGLESVNGKSNIENKVVFANHFFEDYSFSIAGDINLFEIKNLGYSASQANLHYIYKTNLSYGWVFNPSVTIGFGNRNLEFKSLIFEDQIDVYTGNISGVSIDNVTENNSVSFFDMGAGFLVHNSENFVAGINAKHINNPETSFNEEATNKKDLFISAQMGYEINLNPMGRKNLPDNTYIYLYGSASLDGSSSKVELYQEAIIQNFSLGINQHINNYEGISFNTFGVSIGFFHEQMEIGANYSFEILNKQTFSKSYNTFEIFLTFDINSSNDRRGDYSRFFNVF